MKKMITVTEINSEEEPKAISINSKLIFKIEHTHEDSYGKSIIYFKNDLPDIHVNETQEELKNLIDNG